MWNLPSVHDVVGFRRLDACLPQCPSNLAPVVMAVCENMKENIWNLVGKLIACRVFVFDNSCIFHIFDDVVAVLVVCAQPVAHFCHI